MTDISTFFDCCNGPHILARQPNQIVVVAMPGEINVWKADMYLGSVIQMVTATCYLKSDKICSRGGVNCSHAGIDNEAVSSMTRVAEDDETQRYTISSSTSFYAHRSPFRELKSHSNMYDFIDEESENNEDEPDDEEATGSIFLHTKARLSQMPRSSFS
nr:hypothetical protein [Tanacetum cinerariifolium]